MTDRPYRENAGRKRSGPCGWSRVVTNGDRHGSAAFARDTSLSMFRPRPGNLWVLLAQPATPTCSTAPVTNSFSDIARRRYRSLFPVGFFSARFIASPLKHSLIYLPTAPRASPGSFASEPLSDGRSERSLAIGSVMLRATRSASVCRAAIVPMAECYPEIPPKTLSYSGSSEKPDRAAAGDGQYQAWFGGEKDHV
jgi:hypothetical protein